MPRLVVAAALGALVLAGGAAAARPAPRPPIVWKPIPFGPARLAQTAAYDRRHYGRDTWRLAGPHAIVEHVTGASSFASTWNAFASNAPDPELGEEPGTCAHFVVDADGTIYQLVRLDVVCRHAVGLNWTAIGIEHVGLSDADVLRNPRQLAASLELTLWLAQRYRIPLADVIGHAESLGSPYHHELYAPWRCQTHADWSRADMDVYRRDLARLARRDRVALPRGPTSARSPRSACSP
jgi:beta-N-acetylhexosaminidase